MRATLRLLARFPALRTIHVHFSVYCATPVTEVNQDMIPSDSTAYRSAVLRELFATLAGTPLRGLTLTLTNLQNYDDPEFVSAPAFRDVLTRLDALNLVITEPMNDYLEAGEQQESRSRHKWWGTFPQTWLAPIQHTVSHLSIRAQLIVGPWGFFPKCDLRGLQFTKLKSLALGGWVMTHPWQLEWLLAQTTLEDLTLDNCSIARYVHNTRPLDDERYGRPRELYWKPTSIWRSDLRWADVFAALARMPHLHRVRSGRHNTVYGDVFPFDSDSTWIPDPEGKKPNPWIRNLLEGGYCAISCGRNHEDLREWFQEQREEADEMNDDDEPLRSFAEVSAKLVPRAQRAVAQARDDKGGDSEDTSIEGLDWAGMEEEEDLDGQMARDLEALQLLGRHIAEREN
jgi:hypothetical protein